MFRVASVLPLASVLLFEQKYNLTLNLAYLPQRCIHDVLLLVVSVVQFLRFLFLFSFLGFLLLFTFLWFLFLFTFLWLSSSPDSRSGKSSGKSSFFGDTSGVGGDA